MSVGYTKHEHLLRPPACRSWQEEGWDCVEGVPLRGMPELSLTRKGLTSWPNFGDSMGKGQKAGETVHTSAMFM